MSIPLVDRNSRHVRKVILRDVAICTRYRSVHVTPFRRLRPLTRQIEHLLRCLISRRLAALTYGALPRQHTLVVVVRVHLHFRLLLLMMRHALVLLRQVVTQASHAVISAHVVAIRRISCILVRHELRWHLGGFRTFIHGLLESRRARHHAILCTVGLAEHAALGVRRHDATSVASTQYLPLSAHEALNILNRYFWHVHELFDEAELVA